MILKSGSILMSFVSSIELLVDSEPLLPEGDIVLGSTAGSVISLLSIDRTDI